MRRTVMACLAAVVVVGAVACRQEQPSLIQPNERPSPSETTPAADKPEVVVPDGPPPRDLVVEDLVEGSGAAAKEGDTVVVHYVGVAYSTGEEFDASWDGGQPLPVTLGQGQVIPGWERGLPGMRPGGRRQLVIPPDLAYGAEGIPEAGIGPNETLIFVVDLIEIV